MPTVANRHKKQKIGTVLSLDVVKLIRERASREGKTISEVIESAVRNYNNMDPQQLQLRLEAFRGLCSEKTKLSFKEVTEILDEDFYY